MGSQSWPEGGADRREAAASVAGSLAAEGLTLGPAARADTQRYVDGELSAEELVARTLARHAVPPPSGQAAR